jgi:hypothetical protein
MSLTVIAIASLHAALPWVAGLKTKKLRWVVVATCIACSAAFVFGNGAYLVMDLLGAGVGFFMGRGHVTPRSSRQYLPAQASGATHLPHQAGAGQPRPTQAASSPRGGTSGIASDNVGAIVVLVIMCFAVVITGLFVATVVTGVDTGEFVLPTVLALPVVWWFISWLGRRLRKVREPRLEPWVRPKNSDDLLRSRRRK